ncbi:transposable element Tcb1 transposase [Trichonephila clavipes]|nr:transposable element Tcb1 transposase [Trichonephila clavipes]
MARFLANRPCIVLEQGWADFSRLRATSNFFKVLRSTQGRSCTTRGLLTTYLIILNRGLVTRTTPELAPLAPNYHTTGGGLCSHQEGTTNRRGRSHPPQCATLREGRQIVRMAVTDRPVTSRTVAQHIESATHHSVSARTIRRRLQQSVLSSRSPLLDLPLTQNHRHLRRQWLDERRMWVAE